MSRALAIWVAAVVGVAWGIPAERSVQSSGPPGGSAAGVEPPCLGQAPDQAGWLFSDIDCDGCASPQQVAAESFALALDSSIDSLQFWGVYAAGGSPPGPDRFTVIFREDAGGLPGNALRAIGPVPATTRAPTANQAGGLPEYEYTLELAPNQDLAAGTYWVEIYNDTSGCAWDCGDGDDEVGIGDFLAVLGTWGEPDVPCDFDGGGVGITEFLKILGSWGPCPPHAWGWETGSLDAANGVAGAATALVRDGAEQWQADPADLALVLVCAGNPFGCPGTGDCCENNGSAGCDDSACCRAVCEVIPLCCDVTWASICADQAANEPDCACFDCENPARCQLSNVANAFESDGATWVAADNVAIDEPAAAEITSLCWRGMYFDNSISDECGPGPDDFRLRYYADDGAGLPGALLAEYSQSLATLTVSAPTATGQLIGGVANEYEHTATHAPLAVTPGQCLWVEIINTGPAAPCVWFWVPSTNGDGYSMHDGTPPDGYDAGDARDNDYSFCLNVGIGGAPPCPQGGPPRPLLSGEGLRERCCATAPPPAPD